MKDCPKLNSGKPVAGPGGKGNSSYPVGKGQPLYGKNQQRGNLADKPIGKGKGKAVKKFSYAVINGKKMKRRFTPMAKERVDCEIDYDEYAG